MIVVGLVVYLVASGLERADKLASSIGAVVALIALVAPYLLPTGKGEPDPAQGAADRVENSGKAEASGGGLANTGVDVEGDARPAQVRRSGDARADGKSSVSNTGVRRRPRS
ncbi:hypothetical protein [Paractinoplanes hotanensis]|uniref:Uncharacterized protein n=1 Tax=Paractinoplanes hotanensis TaxID=2906497 RepID=A0ABT0YBY7_9ACTN|nr:hypothetical protein [Actinoplanes hotanensis]MCM4083557.1 hypothetical protein [Actinoplanes hotanensis]